MLRTVPARLRFVNDPEPEPAGGTPTETEAMSVAERFDFPADTPLSQMNDAQKAEYWREKAQKHEKAWRAAEKTDPASARTASELRELRHKAAEYDKYAESQKTELQKITERAEKAEKAAAEAAAKSLRLEVAAAKGVPADLLTADTAEALEAQAAALLAFKGTLPTAPPATGQGNQGGPVSVGEKQLSREDLKNMTPDQITEAKSKGQLDTVLGIKRPS